MKGKIIVLIIFIEFALCACAINTTDAATTEQSEKVQVVIEEKTEEIVETEPDVYIAECMLSKEMQLEIYNICEQQGVPYTLVMAVIKRESNFNAQAVGDGGNSVGLMQIQERWHYGTMEELGVTSLYNPIDNVRVGVAILKSHFKNSDNTYYVLMKYNGGPA